MRRIAVALLIVGLASPAIGQPAGDHVSPRIVEAVGTRFIAAYKLGGMAATTIDVQACYEATTDARTARNRSAVIACLLYDCSAMAMDRAWRHASIARGEPDVGPTSGYLRDEAFDARMAIYTWVPFGREDVNAFRSYMGSAPWKIVSRLTREVR